MLMHVKLGLPSAAFADPPPQPHPLLDATSGGNIQLLQFPTNSNNLPKTCTRADFLAISLVLFSSLADFVSGSVLQSSWLQPRRRNAQVFGFFLAHCSFELFQLIIKCHQRSLQVRMKCVALALVFEALLFRSYCDWVAQFSGENQNQEPFILFPCPCSIMATVANYWT